MGQVGQTANHPGFTADGQKIFGQKAAESDSGDALGSPKEKMASGFPSGWLPGVDAFLNSSH